jgi:hypothetical protein
METDIVVFKSRRKLGHGYEKLQAKYKMQNFSVQWMDLSKRQPLKGMTDDSERVAAVRPFFPWPL